MKSPTPAPAADKLAAPAAAPAFALLLEARGPRIAGQIVYGSEAAIAEICDAGAARPATALEVELADPFHFALEA